MVITCCRGGIDTAVLQSLNSYVIELIPILWQALQNDFRSFNSNVKELEPFIYIINLQMKIEKTMTIDTQFYF